MCVYIVCFVCGVCWGVCAAADLNKSHKEGAGGGGGGLGGAGLWGGRQKGVFSLGNMHGRAIMGGFTYRI